MSASCGSRTQRRRRIDNEKVRQTEYFRDGTPIDDWFYETKIPQLSELGKQYVLTEYGIWDDGKIYTKEIQKVIDLVAEEGGGVLVVPPGTYLTGSIYFKQGVHLYISAGATLKGSNDISDYDLCETRIEGETCLYYTALINADGVDGFTMCGGGTIDGNGLRSWKAFWQRRIWNPQCTNKDEQRPRLVYISNCSNVLIADLHLQNAHFWTTHIYKCHHVKYINCNIFSPAEPVKAPSTDAIDIDVCTDVLVKNCYLEVNDDSVVLKGGKGPWADTAPENGSNERIIVEEIEGKIQDFININPWTQFYDLKDRKDIPLSYADHIVIRNCNCDCDHYFNVKADKEQYILTDFTFENLNIRAKVNGFCEDMIQHVSVHNVNVKAAIDQEINGLLPEKNEEEENV